MSIPQGLMFNLPVEQSKCLTSFAWLKQSIKRKSDHFSDNRQLNCWSGEVATANSSKYILVRLEIIQNDTTSMKWYQFIFMRNCCHMWIGIMYQHTGEMMKPVLQRSRSVLCHSELTALSLLYVNHCRIMLSWSKSASCSISHWGVSTSSRPAPTVWK